MLQIQKSICKGECKVGSMHVYMFAGLHGGLVQQPCRLLNCRLWSDQERLLVVYELAWPSEPQRQGATQLRALHTQGIIFCKCMPTAALPR